MAPSDPSDQSAAPQSDEGTAAAVLERLFAAHRHPSGRPYTFAEVASTVNSRYAHLLAGGRMDPTHLSKIRSGAIRDPGRRTILAICAFFQVPAATFFPELGEELVAQPFEEQLGLLLQGSGLSPQVQQHLAGLIRALQAAERG